MMKTLVIFSHSYQDQSISNVAIAEEFARAGFEVRNLEQLYPDGVIDVTAEQAALVAADVIIWQHPIFWFNVTPMLKKWQDEVLQYGFAYGTGGDKLHGKKFIHSYTTGSGAEVYAGELGKAISASVLASAGYCGMDIQPVQSAFGHLAMTNPDAADRARQHAQRVIAYVKGL